MLGYIIDIFLSKLVHRDSQNKTGKLYNECKYNLFEHIEHEKMQKN